MELAAAPSRWPCYNELQQLLERDPGGITFVIAEPFILDHHVDTLCFVTFLRDAMSWRCDVEWSGEAVEGFPVELITHLPPPSTVTSESLERWQATHTYGRLYWRQAPIGIHVVDERQPGDKRLHTVRFLGDLAPICHTRGPVELAALSPEQRQAAQSLRERGWALVLDGWATFLPYRMRRTPIAWNEI